MLSLFAKPLYVAVAMLFIFGGASTYAFFKGKAYCENKVAVAVAEAHKEAEEKRDKLTLKHMAFVRVLNQENAKVREELRHAIHDNPNCYFTPDAILLLDKARGVSEPASLDAHTIAAPSTHLSRQGAAEQWAKDGEQNILCRERINEFIQWHED